MQSLRLLAKVQFLKTAKCFLQEQRKASLLLGQKQLNKRRIYMSKNVLVISSSLRKGSNSEMLADEFLKGAKEAGHNAEKLSLAGKTINFCIGCLSCQKTHKCVIDDDSREITEKMLNADVIVFATPVYYYSVCGQLKTLLDRANPLYPSDYKFRDGLSSCDCRRRQSRNGQGNRNGNSRLG